MWNGVLGTLTPAIPAQPGWQLEYEAVNLSIVRDWAEENCTKLLLAAEVRLSEMPPTSSAGAIAVSGPEREQSEEAIEVLANLIAVATRTSRAISSPIPWLGLIPETDAERSLLAGSTGLDLKGHSVLQFPQMLDLENVLDALLDRLDGVAILAEALSSGHASGSFHEFMRLFERAFALSSGKLIDPLASFLEQAGLGYTNIEVRQWIDEVRHPLTHADRRAAFLLEKDVRPFAGRVTQAAYDVLLNKTTWRAPATERRSVWDPDCGTTSSGGDSFITKGRDAHFGYQALDDSLVFPINLGAVLKELPEGIWAQLSGKGDRISIARGPVLVKAERPNQPIDSA